MKPLFIKNDVGRKQRTKVGKHAIEFFAGTALVTKCARELGYNCTSVDYDIRLNPDYCCNILSFDYSLFTYPIDFCWFSPDCRLLSRAADQTNWDKKIIKKRVYEYKPVTAAAVNSLALVAKTFEIINVLKPRVFIIENPIGRIQHLPGMKLQGLNRYFVNYIDWGFEYSKETYIFTNLMLPLPVVKSARKAPGLRTVQNRKKRSTIPQALIEFLLSYL